MGQKVHPKSFRLGIIRRHDSLWYAGHGAEYRHNVGVDFRIRDYIRRNVANGAISKVMIERRPGDLRVNIFSGRAGSIIGKGGSSMDSLRDKLRLHVGESDLKLDVTEVKEADLDAVIVADSIARQLERRVMYRRLMRRAVQNAMRARSDARAEGIKIKLSGRLRGAEIARSETVVEGRVPLHTLRANIDYGLAEAVTVYGVIGVKVWIYRGIAPLLRDEPSVKEAGHAAAKTS